MLICRSRLLLAGLLALLWLLPAGAWACSVPVFRYALERWPADAFQLVVFHREPLSTNQQALVDAWKEAAEKGLANVGVEVVNISSVLSDAHQKLWKAQSNVVLPWLVAQYPPEKEIEMPVFAGPLNAEAVKTLLDSPARRDIARRLCKGDSAVWLLLESGDKARDDRVAALFETESRNLEKSLKLPEADADGPQVRSDVPLKIAFSMLRVSRANPAERALRDMLLNVDGELAKVTEPVVFAVFGRGRALPLPIGKNLGAEVIREAAEFLTSACSCEVKTMNPGVDLLIAADWEGCLEGRVVKDPELPALIGITQFAAATTNHDTNLRAKTNAPTKSAHRSGLTRNLSFVLLLAIVGSAIGTMFLKRKPNRLE